MNKSTLLDLYDEALAELAAEREAVQKGLLVAMRDGWNGHPRSPNLDPGAPGVPHKPEALPDELRGTLGYQDPVGAVVAATGARDAAAKETDEFVANVSFVVRRLRRNRDLRVKHTPRDPSLFDQQEASDPEPGCVSCARVDSPGTVGKDKRNRTPWWNAVAREVTLADGSTAALCEWCRSHARSTGSLPPVGDVEAYRDGRRVQRRSA